MSYEHQEGSAQRETGQAHAGPVAAHGASAWRAHYWKTPVRLNLQNPNLKPVICQPLPSTAQLNCSYNSQLAAYLPSPDKLQGNPEVVRPPQTHSPLCLIPLERP